jgi:hypothetical protein
MSGETIGARPLALLHATIDEHLNPLQPSIPHWIHGAGPGDQKCVFDVPRQYGIHASHA